MTKSANGAANCVTQMYASSCLCVIEHIDQTSVYQNTVASHPTAEAVGHMWPRKVFLSNRPVNPGRHSHAVHHKANRNQAGSEPAAGKAHYRRYAHSIHDEQVLQMTDNTAWGGHAWILSALVFVTGALPLTSAVAQEGGTCAGDAAGHLAARLLRDGVRRQHRPCPASR
jgi:hypothetical protein